MEQRYPLAFRFQQEKSSSVSFVGDESVVLPILARRWGFEFSCAHRSTKQKA